MLNKVTDANTITWTITPTAEAKTTVITVAGSVKGTPAAGKPITGVTVKNADVTCPTDCTGVTFPALTEFTCTYSCPVLPNDSKGTANIVAAVAFEGGPSTATETASLPGTLTATLDETAVLRGARARARGSRARGAHGEARKVVL